MKGFGGMQQLMKQANQLQAKMKKAQEELNTREYTGTAGGNAVQITVNGEYNLLAVKIDPEVMKSGDHEMLQDLVLAAANDAIKTARDTSAQEMQKLTGGMNIPGLF